MRDATALKDEEEFSGFGKVSFLSDLYLKAGFRGDFVVLPEFSASELIRVSV